jgi:hypothetical protein
MISITYQRACETFRFARRNGPSGFPGFQFRRRSKRNDPRAGVPRASCLKERRQGRRASKDAGAFCLRIEKHSLRQAHGGLSRPVRDASERGLGSATKRRKKLRKGAAKHLKSLARVNLCAPVLHHWSKLALGPASASALPTSSPRSSIEVCSRSERSSPFACRSACSGERATLTVTFDSTSGCR